MHREDPLSPAKGILLGCLLGAMLWMLLFFMYWYFASPASAGGKPPREMRIYESGKPATPKFTVKERSDGSLGVYEHNRHGQELLPKYIIKNNKVYDPKNPALPLYETDDRLKAE